MATGGDKQIMEEIKSGLTKPCHLPDVKNQISALHSLSAKEKGKYERKVSNMIEKKEKIEQELETLKMIFLKKACSGLPKELHCLLKESKVTEEEDYLGLSSKRENFVSISPFSKKGLLLAAIEFGNTYSGFAFSFFNSPGEIKYSVWHGFNSSTSKTPTVVLLNSEENFVAFGYEAEEKYTKLIDNNEEQGYYYFHSFRNCLERNLLPTTDSLIKDESGKPLRIQSVFALSIKFLISKIYDEVNASARNFTMDDMNIILTVPATWNDAQIKYFKEAATMAGVKQELLAIVLEPVAASANWSQKNTKDTENRSSESNENKKYLVLDLGGDTSTFTVLSKTGTGHDEVLSTVVSPWGGNSVNHEFTIFLHEIFEVEVMEKLKKDNFSDYYGLMKHFETIKYTSSSQNVVCINIPSALCKAYEWVTQETIQKAVVSTKYGEDLAFKSSQLHVSIDIFHDFFNPAKNGILEYLSKVLCKNENLEVNTIVMVGGFSECLIIQRAIIDAFPTKNVIPFEPGLSILKGAVFCGHIPLTLSGRVAKYTYGIQCCQKFDTKVHPKNKKITVGDTAYCKDVFCKYVERGSEVPVGTKATHIFRALDPEKSYLACELYASTEKNPAFIDDVSCKFIGTISVVLPKVRPECLIIEENLIFKETELLIEARDISFQTYTVYFTFQ